MPHDSHTQGDAEDALPDQRRDRVLDISGRAVIGKAGDEALDQADGPIGGAQQQRAGIERDLSRHQRSHNGAPFGGSKTELVCATL